MKFKLSLKLIAALLFFSLIFVTGCSKKEPANSKFIGTYSVTDKWMSSVEMLGTGSLDYNLVIEPDGEEGNSVLISNLNKTIDGVKGTVSGDTLLIARQKSKSSSGATYDILENYGFLVENKLVLAFEYDDRQYANSIGLIFCSIEGTKNSKPSEKK